MVAKMYVSVYILGEWLLIWVCEIVNVINDRSNWKYAVAGVGVNLITDLGFSAVFDCDWCSDDAVENFD